MTTLSTKSLRSAAYTAAAFANRRRWRRHPAPPAAARRRCRPGARRARSSRAGRRRRSGCSRSQRAHRARTSRAARARAARRRRSTGPAPTPRPRRRPSSRRQTARRPGRSPVACAGSAPCRRREGSWAHRRRRPARLHPRATSRTSSIGLASPGSGNAPVSCTTSQWFSGFRNVRIAISERPHASPRTSSGSTISVRRSAAAAPRCAPQHLVIVVGTVDHDAVAQPVRRTQARPTDRG